jgi:hypothetical protein
MSFQSQIKAPINSWRCWSAALAIASSIVWILGRESERAARRERQHWETGKEAAAADTARTVPVLLRSVEAACTYIIYVLLYVHSAVNPKTLKPSYVGTTSFSREPKDGGEVDPIKP